MGRKPRTNQLPGSASSHIFQKVSQNKTPILTPIRYHSQHHNSNVFRVGTKLHIGCGSRRLEGWINADAVKGVGEIVLDLHDELPQNTFMEIYGSHVLEHCWPQDTPNILRRLYDALLPGGTLRLSVPDLRLVVKNCLDSNAYGADWSAMTVLFGGEFSRSTPDPDLHRQAFWKERLEKLLTDAGFTKVRTWGRGQYPIIDALRDYATFPCDAEGKSLISLNMEADRPQDRINVPRPNFASVSGAVIDVSIILGTVNRPEMLRDCVDAIRKSVVGLTYEIVIAYGTKEDQSYEWMHTQNDIVPVLGGMNGAIEAFNRAYAASKGRFICQINDDVLVDGDSIIRAVRHLNIKSESAGVVFKFDRGEGKGYRHERIVDVLHPNQMLVRRETCESVIERIGAFWGDDNHKTDKTYGGDTAFGVVCRHLGLRLDSVDGVSCRDLLAPDELRQRNADAVADNHGSKWRAMFGSYMTTFASQSAIDEWPNAYVPSRGMAPRRSPIEAGRSLRVLLLPISIAGWPQTALREAFSRIGPTEIVVHDGKIRNTGNVFVVAQKHKPDLVWAQIQGDGWQEFSRALRKIVGPQCTMVMWTGDVRTDASQPVERWLVSMAGSFDIILADNCTYPRKLAREKVCAGYLSHGYESELHWEPQIKAESGGAVFIGTNYRNLDGGSREVLFNMVDQQLPGVLTLYGNSWKGSNARGSVDITEAGRIMRRTPITISTSLFNNLERYTSNRLKYAFASGAVTAVERFPDMEGLGLKHGHNCLTWSTPNELVSLIRDWVKPEKALERQFIRERARELAVERFSWNRSVEELLAIVRDYRARKHLP